MIQTLYPQTENQNWCKFRNSSNPQAEFLDALCARGKYAGIKQPRVLYGGAGFGGKSYALRTATMELNGVLRAAGFPGRWGALFCSDYPKLVDRHVRHLQKEMGQFGKVGRSQTHGLHFRFYDPSLGGFFLRNAKDPESYRGIEFDWILFDELTESLRDVYDAIIYILRSGDRLPFEAFGAATNPDGVGHGWVKKLWIERDFEGEIGQNPDNYVFIPARAPDNPMFRPEIELKLCGFADPALVKARWEGSWDIASGSRFANYNRFVHQFDWPEFEATYGGDYSYQELLKDPELFKLYGSLDYGTDLNSASAFYLHAVDFKKRVWTIGELYMRGMYLQDQAEAIRDYLNGRTLERLYGDPSLAGKDSDGISRLAKFRRLGINIMPGINDRIEGWASLDSALHTRLNPQTGERVQPAWRIHRSAMELHKFLSTAPRCERRMEDVSGKFRDDHAGDSVRYFIHSYFVSSKGKPDKKTARNRITGGTRTNI